MKEPPHGSPEDWTTREKVPQPEFVILDDKDEAPQGEKFEDLARVLGMQVPLRLRLLFFLLLFPVTLWFAIASVSCALMGLLYLLTAMRVEDFYSLYCRMWRQLKRASVFALSLFLAVISPSMGLGVLMLYFILHEDKNSNMARMVRSNLFKYN